MKKILSFILVLCMIIPCGFLFTGCNEDKTEIRIVNISFNPSVEFILENNRVVTVNATNDEGNFIIAEADFTGLNVEDAVDLFISTIQENGYLVNGNLISNKNFKVEISGDDAENVFDYIKDSANEYLEELGVNVNFSFEQITKEDLQVLVEECMRDLSYQEIGNLSQQDLIKLIKKSRQETSNILSQELKNLYYQTRAEELLKAKFTEVNNFIAFNVLITDDNRLNFEDSLDIFNQRIDQLRNEYINNFLSPYSEYQIAMQSYIEVKHNLLEAYMTDSNISELSNEYSIAEIRLENAKLDAENLLVSYKESLETALTRVNNNFNTILRFLNQENINRAIDTVKDSFKASFDEEYKSYINNIYWKNLAPEL